MAFKEISVKQEIEKQKEIDPDFKKLWDESRTEYKLIGEMIETKKDSGKITEKLL